MAKMETPYEEEKMKKAPKNKMWGSSERAYLINSIAGYETAASTIRLQLKSGQSVEIKFRVAALAEKALDGLKEYFDEDIFCDDPCNICKHFCTESGKFKCNAKFECTRYDEFEEIEEELIEKHKSQS
jgi:hypothetical protein